MEIESGPIHDNEARRRPAVERVYQNSQIAVSWEPKLCIHAGYCFRTLPDVFQPESRPWVKVDAATADKIVEAVMLCPTGALHFERLDGGPQEPAPESTTINARPTGRLPANADTAKGPLRKNNQAPLRILPHGGGDLD